MTHQIFNLPPQQPLSAAGRVLPGAKAYFFLTDSDTPTPVYTTHELSTTHAVPVVADAGGRFATIYLDPEITYKVTITDANDVLLYTIDPCNDVTLSAAIIGGLLYPISAAETAADVTPVDYTYPHGCINRYGTNTSPGATAMDDAVAAAFDQRYEGGPNPYGLNQIYRLTDPFALANDAEDVHFYCEKGGQLLIDHNGDGLVWVVDNENSEGNAISNWHILGPNEHLPTEPGYDPPSNGSGICMNRNVSHTTGDNTNEGSESNAPPQYNGFLRDVRVEGFNRGLDLQSVIGLNVWGSVFQYNQTGVRIDGGQCNANHFFGTHIRYNRTIALASTGRTGGSLSNATANTFVGCLIESNTPYEEGAFPPGGTPPDDSVGIYLSNSYDFSFFGCYSENHKASIYLTGASKGHKFYAYRLGSGGGGTRLDEITLDGAGVNNNFFDMHADSTSLTEVNFVSNNGSQFYNEVTGSGVNFVPAEVDGPIYFHNMKPSEAFSNDKGYSLIRAGHWGARSNVGEGTSPGNIDGIGTGSGALNVRGITEIIFGNGITGTTTIDELVGADTLRLLVIRNMQSSHNVILASAAFGTVGGSLTLNTSGQEVRFWIDQNGVCREMSRNFIVSAGTYTVTNPSTDRALNVSADTTAQVAAVLGTLIADLQGRGYLS